MDPGTEQFLRAAIIRLAALLPALTLHEFAHAWSAVRAGDPTPQMHGRVTLNPLAHLDPIGTLAIIFLPIGWAKPVPINPANFRSPSRDIIWTSAAGPLSNIAQGIFWALVLRALTIFAPGLVWQANGPTLAAGFVAFMVLLNFALAIFNLIPIGPLDGHHILEYTLPYEQAVSYRRFNSRYGMFVLIGLILLGGRVLFLLISVPTQLLGSMISGMDILRTIGGARLFT